MRLFGRKRIEIVKSGELIPEKIKLSTLLDLVQNGDLIGLKIKKCDNSDAMCRVLEFDKFRVDFSEWAEWTVRIDIYNENDAFQVYKSPGLKIDWYKGTIELAKLGKGSLDVEWDHEGAWCAYITDQIKEAKYQLELKREKIKSDERLKKKQEEEDKKRIIEEKKKNFNSLFKNKL